MLFLFANIIAIVLYLTAGICCTITLKQRLLSKEEPKKLIEQAEIKQQLIIKPNVLKLIALAVVLHGIGVYDEIVKAEGLALGFFKVSSLIAWCINLIILVSGLRKPLHNLWLLLLPMSIITVTISLFSGGPIWQHITFGIGAHILFSILAYSLFTIAMLQAMLLAWQNHQLKKHQVKGFIQLMPPLETMETLLFEIVWVGQILLTLGIIVGAIYIDDIFAQHLAHKTVLSLLAWTMFAALLLGKYWMGWRGNRAVRWIFSGFCALMLAFFGSKLVLEIILQR